ncbi:hypothetical protein [Modestobacter lapidis]|nr:hypothetical protein [Modestobacter lapidis]
MSQTRDTSDVSVLFAGEVYQELVRIAKQRNVSVEDVLRDAVSLEKYAFETRQGGGKILVWTPDGETRELQVQ